MTYSVTINNTAKAETNSFDAMVAFVYGHEDIESINVDYIEDGRKLNSCCNGMNPVANFADCLKSYRMGR